VRRISLGSLGTWLSGVFRSSFSISTGALDGGGSGYRGGTAELGLLELGDDSSEASLPLCSDLGGVGGTWKDIDDEFRIGFFVWSVGEGGAVERGVKISVGTMLMDII